MVDMSLSPEFIWDEGSRQFDIRLHGCALLLGVDTAHLGTPQAHHVAVMRFADSDVVRVVQLPEMHDTQPPTTIWHAVTLLRNQHPDKPDAVQVEICTIRQVIRNAIAEYEQGEQPCLAH